MPTWKIIFWNSCSCSIYPTMLNSSWPPPAKLEPLNSSLRSWKKLWKRQHPQLPLLLLHASPLVQHLIFLVIRIYCRHQPAHCSRIMAHGTILDSVSVAPEKVKFVDILDSDSASNLEVIGSLVLKTCTASLVLPLCSFHPIISPYPRSSSICLEIPQCHCIK